MIIGAIEPQDEFIHKCKLIVETEREEHINNEILKLQDVILKAVRLNLNGCEVNSLNLEEETLKRFKDAGYIFNTLECEIDDYRPYTIEFIWWGDYEPINEVMVITEKSKDINESISEALARHSIGTSY